MKYYTLLSLLGLGLLSFKNKEPKLSADFELKTFEKNLALIPEGIYCLDQARSEVLWKGFDGDLTKELYSGDTCTTINLFYLSKTEVTNGQYLAFVNDVKKRDTILYKKLLPDTLVWEEKLAANKAYIEYYFRHPAYVNYPIVGVSYEQATAYCNWLTEKYLGMENRKFKNVKFRLPKLREWSYAASGGGSHTVFPWDGEITKDKKGKVLANFFIFNQRSLVRLHDTLTESEELIVVNAYGDSFLDGYADVTAPVDSYSPNKYGLYCMAGNVEEYVAEIGYSKGGSWRDSGYYLQNNVYQTYDSKSSVTKYRGFRFAMEVLN